MATEASNEHTALDVIRSHQRNAPVNVRGIARDLGLHVSEEYLGPHVAGKIAKRRFMPGYEIVVNAEDHDRRKRFTLAHEIAHFVLHRDLIGDEFTENEMYRGPLGGHAETQANRLAADILMPYFLIERLYNAGVRDHMDLARRFEVSPRAMEIRLDGFKRAQAREALGSGDAIPLAPGI